jgi:hypothetical protein
MLILSTFVNYVALAEGMKAELANAGITLTIITANATVVDQEVSMGQFKSRIPLELSNSTPKRVFLYLVGFGWMFARRKAEQSRPGAVRGPRLGKLVMEYQNTAPATPFSTKYLYELETYMVKDVSVNLLFVNKDMGDYDTSQFTGWF